MGAGARTSAGGVGVGRGEVDSAVLTHLHEDHFGWAVGLGGVAMFQGARHVVQRAEMSSLRPRDSARTYVVDPLRRAGLLQEIDATTGRISIAGPTGWSRFCCFRGCGR
ncbi:MBL fold metallo-hydrolase [Streptomyces sp. NPDC014724]|uniref:MBL fold metallo-hydrolase n=1 Tax=unclassified Streptomyces TaxID=2593676 RepID=UPI00370124F4